MNSVTITPLTVGQMAAHCYIVSDPKTREGIIIDPGDDSEYISDTLLKLQVTPMMIVATHGHFDHLMAAYALKLGFGIPFYLHPDDAFLLGRMQDSAKHFLDLVYVDPAPSIDKNLSDGDIIGVGVVSLTVLHTPGHTPGSICLYEKNSGVLFTGDTIFAEGGVGRTDHSYASRELLRLSMKRILSYPASTRVLAGHGEETTIGAQIGYHVQ